MAQQKVTFDAATLADAIIKAARIAPNKGAAFDKAAGIHMEVRPDDKAVIVKATDLEVTYRQIVPVQEVKADRVLFWRVPSNLLSGLMSQINVGGGSTITLVDPGDSAIRIISGNLKVKLQMQDPADFPNWEPFNSDNMADANDFAQKVAQVSWACAKKNNQILSGVHIDGESLIGCDTNVAAIVPCKVPLQKEVTVPLWTVTPILAKASDVRLAATDKTLNIHLDKETQATSRLLEGAYPNVKGLHRTDYTGKVKFHRAATLEAVNRLLVVAREDRKMPTVKLTFNPGLVRTCTFDLQVEDKGRIQDTIEVTGTYDEPFEIYFTPSLFVPAIESSKEDQVEMEYGHPERTLASMKPVRISDGTGYEALVMPRKP